MHMLGHFFGGAGFPFFEHGVLSGADFFNVVVHVFNEKDVVVESLFVFWVPRCATSDGVL